MPAITDVDILDLARTYSRDKDPVDQGLSDTEMYSLLDQAMQDYSSFYPQDAVTELSTLTLSSGAEATSFLPTGNPNVRNLVRCEISSSGRAAELERITVGAARRLQEVEAETGTPRMWAAERLPGSASQGNDWVIYTVPIPSGSTVLKFWATLYPTALLTMGFCVYGETAARIVARMAGIEAAKILGQDPGYIQSVAAGLPELIRNHALREMADNRPRSGMRRAQS